MEREGLQPNYTTFEEDNSDQSFPSDREKDGKGDLKYLINKVIFVRNDGSYTVLENEVMRINRLNKRLMKWEEIIKVNADYLGVRVYQVGLSYKPGNTWKGRDITEYFRRVREYIGKDGLMAYAWVAEMQKRMEVHYHAEIITGRDCRKIPMPDKKGHWVNGSSSRKEVGSMDVGYLTSDYMRKKEQKSNYPRGIRVHSTWLNSKYFGEIENWAMRSVSYPAWLVNKVNNEGLINPVIKRAKGGGFMVAGKYYWKNEGGYVLVGKDASDYLEMEKYRFPIPF